MYIIQLTLSQVQPLCTELATDIHILPWLPIAAACTLDKALAVAQFSPSPPHTHTHMHCPKGASTHRGPVLQSDVGGLQLLHSLPSIHQLCHQVLILKWG